MQPRGMEKNVLCTPRARVRRGTSATSSAARARRRRREPRGAQRAALWQPPELVDPSQSGRLRTFPSSAASRRWGSGRLRTFPSSAASATLGKRPFAHVSALRETRPLPSALCETHFTTLLAKKNKFNSSGASARSSAARFQVPRSRRRGHFGDFERCASSSTRREPRGAQRAALRHLRSLSIRPQAAVCARFRAPPPPRSWGSGRLRTFPRSAKVAKRARFPRRCARLILLPTTQRK